MLIIQTTVPTSDAGEGLATKIVEAKLAACVQVLPRMTSVYIWKDRVTSEGEHLLLIKTLPARFDELAEFIKANHPYEVPEIVAIEAAKVSGPYLDWINEVVGE